MSIAELTSKYGNFYVPRFKITIDGAPLAANKTIAVLNLKVEEKLNEGANFSFTISEEFDVETQEFVWLESPLFQLDNVVKIEMGYENTFMPMIEGKISKIAPSFFSKDTPTIEISGHDKSFDALKRPAPAKTYEKKSYSDIANELAGQAGLTPDVETTTKVQDKIQKTNNQTNFAFLQELAKKAKLKVWFDTTTLFFKKQEDEKAEIMTLALGRDIVRFSPQIDDSNVVHEVEVRCSNPKDPSKPFVGIAKAGSESKQESGKKSAANWVFQKKAPVKKVIDNVMVKSQSEAETLAKEELNKHSDTFITGQVECVGIPEIKTGVCIELDRMGERFSGKYYVTGVTHTIDEAGYKTKFNVKRNAV